MTCPVQDLGASAWSHVSCDPKNPVFTATPWELPSAVSAFISLVVSGDTHDVKIR